MSSSHKHEDEDKEERIARPICDQWVALSARTSGGGGGGEGIGGTATDAGPLFAPPLAPAEATVAAGVGVSGKNPPLSNQSPEMSWRAGLCGSGASEIKTAHAHSREDADESSPPSQLDLSTLLGINDAGSGGNTGVGGLQMPRMPSALNPYPPLTNGLELCGQGGQQGPYDRMMATAMSAAAAAAATTAAGSKSEAAGTGEFSFRSFPSAEIFGSIPSSSETVAHREVEERGWAAESSISAAKTNLLQQQQQQRRLQQQLVQQQQLLRLRFQQQRLQEQEMQQRRQFQVRLQQRRQQQQAVLEERETASAAEDGTSSWHSGSIDDFSEREEEKALTPEERLERNRIRNRDHSRKSRQRKKALVEGMKRQVKELGAYRMLVEQAHDLISAHTTDDRNLFLYASDAFKRTLGIDSEDLLGVKLINIVHPDDSVKVAETLRRALLCNHVQVVGYRLTHRGREHLVETSLRMTPSRLVAVTRIVASGSA